MRLGVRHAKSQPAPFMSSISAFGLANCCNMSKSATTMPRPSDVTPNRSRYAKLRDRFSGAMPRREARIRLLNFNSNALVLDSTQLRRIHAASRSVLVRSFSFISMRTTAAYEAASSSAAARANAASRRNASRTASPGTASTRTAVTARSDSSATVWRSTVGSASAAIGSLTSTVAAWPLWQPKDSTEPSMSRCRKRGRSPSFKRLVFFGRRWTTAASRSAAKLPSLICENSAVARTASQSERGTGIPFVGGLNLVKNLTVRRSDRIDRYQHAGKALADRSELGAAQPQRIADDAHRGQRHRGRGHDRREQKPENRIEHAGRDRHPGGIVDEREKQILPDVAHDGPRERARLD